MRDLATQHDLDLDEALVTLWDNGFDEIGDVDDRISPTKVGRAHQALGIANPREIRTVAYWEAALRITKADLVQKLAELNVTLPPGARVLPKGALAKLRRISSVPSPGPYRTQEMQESLRETGHQQPEFSWHNIGAERECALLSVRDVCRIHDALSAEFANSPDPILPPGVRDPGLLESAVARAGTSLGDVKKYPTAEMAGAALLHSLIHNHAFYNGNKRTALVSTLVTLDRNGLLLTCDEQALFKFVLRVAQHRITPASSSFMADRETAAIAQWIFDNSRPISKGERPIRWRELRRNLLRLGCTLEGPLPGNKMKVRRVVSARNFLGIRRERELLFTAWYGGEGREIKIDHLHSLRRALHLDDEAGYDSDYFYGSDPRDPDEFIAEYRNILKRLAKL